MQPQSETMNPENGQTLAERSRETVAQARDRANTGLDQATTTVGRSMERVGGAIDSAGRSASGTFQRAGRYMQESDPSTMTEDIAEIVRRHPGATLCVGIGLGMLASRLFSPRPPR